MICNTVRDSLVSCQNVLLYRPSFSPQIWRSGIHLTAVVIFYSTHSLSSCTAIILWLYLWQCNMRCPVVVTFISFTGSDQYASEVMLFADPTTTHGLRGLSMYPPTHTHHTHHTHYTLWRVPGPSCHPVIRSEQALKVDSTGITLHIWLWREVVQLSFPEAQADSCHPGSCHPGSWMLAGADTFDINILFLKTLQQSFFCLHSSTSLFFYWTLPNISLSTEDATAWGKLNCARGKCYLMLIANTKLQGNQSLVSQSPGNFAIWLVSSVSPPIIVAAGTVVVVPWASTIWPWPRLPIVSPSKPSSPPERDRESPS